MAKNKKKRKKQQRPTSPLPFVLAGAALVVVVAVALVSTTNSKPGQFVSERPGDHEHLGTTNTPPGGDPPTSGPHQSGLAPWGVNRDYVPPERWLHNLEDGGVAILYNCLDCSELIAELAALVQRHRDRDRHVLMAYWPGMTPVIALRAWTRRQDLTEFDQSAIERFINAYEGIDHHLLRG